MSNFKPGDKVKCIDAGDSGLTLYKIYTVKDVKLFIGFNGLILPGTWLVSVDELSDTTFFTWRFILNICTCGGTKLKLPHSRWCDLTQE